MILTVPAIQLVVSVNNARKTIYMFITLEKLHICVPYNSYKF